jgi:flagellar biosynthesis protein FliQ
MTPEAVVEIGQSALHTTLMVAGPMLLAGMAIGLVISLIQAATQVNEMTMTFVPKIVVVFLVMVLSLPWAIGHLTRFARDMFERLAWM